MFIIEGSDSLGKTTAAKRMVEHITQVRTGFYYPVRYQHMTRPPSQHFNFDTDYLDMMSHFAIQDRFHLGALAYHDDVMPVESLRWIEGHLALHASFVVLMVAEDTGWYLRKMQEETREQMFDLGFRVKANQRFLDMANGNCDIVPHVDLVRTVNGPDDYPTEKDFAEWSVLWLKRFNLLRQSGGLAWRGV